MACHIIETANKVARDVPKGASLPLPVRAALSAALEQEQQSQADLAAIVAHHGEIRPFANLAKSGRRHSAAIARLMKAYGIDAGKPARQTDVPVDTPSEARARIEASMRAEVTLYDTVLIPAVAEQPGIEVVFSTLRDAARDRHLPALARHAGSDAAPDLRSDPHDHGCGGGHRHRHGNGNGCGHHHDQNKGH